MNSPLSQSSRLPQIQPQQQELLSSQPFATSKLCSSYSTKNESNGGMPKPKKENTGGRRIRKTRLQRLMSSIKGLKARLGTLSRWTLGLEDGVEELNGDEKESNMEGMDIKMEG